MKLKEVKKEISQVLGEQKTLQALKLEAVRVFGSQMNISWSSLKEAVIAVDRHIDFLQLKSLQINGEIKNSLLMKLSASKLAEARKLSVRLLSEDHAKKFINDGCPEVRYAVYRKLPLSLLETIAQRRPNEYFLQDLLKEVSDKKEKEDKNPHNQMEFELSDNWYENKALNLLSDYGKAEIENSWEEKAVQAFCNHTKATSGVIINRDKLWKALQKVMKADEERALERENISESNQHFEEFEDFEKSYKENPIANLMKYSGIEFIRKANDIFSIKESKLPQSLRFSLLAEGSRISLVPSIGKLPLGETYNSLNEEALTRYCEQWNKINSLRGERVHINWFLADDDNFVFEVEG